MKLSQFKYYFIVTTLLFSNEAQGQLSYQASHIPFENSSMLGYTRDMIQDSTGLLWFSSSVQGINVYDGKKIRVYEQSSQRNYFPFRRGAQLHERKNRNFLISDWGFIEGAIYEYNPYSRLIVDSIHQHSINPKRIYNFTIDTENAVWAVSDPFDEGDFVYLYKEQEKGTLTIIDTLQINTYVTVIQKDDHIMVSAKESIRKYDLNGNLEKIYVLHDNGKIVNPFVVDFDSSERLFVKSNHTGGNELSRNFFVYNEVEDEFEIFPVTYNEALTHTQYFNFIDNELWIGGLYEKLWKVNLESGDVENYTESIRNVLGSNFYILGVFKDASNQRWVTTSKGLIKLTPTINNGNNFTLQYPINITSVVKYNGVRDKEEYLNCASLVQINLNQNDSWFEVDFSLPSYQQNLYYSYQLEGFEAEWSTPSKEGIFRLSGAPPGKYQLHLKAGLDPETMDLSNRTLPVYVKGDWFRTWWFYVMCALIMAFIVYAITNYRYQLKLKRAAEIQNIRIKLSSELHDDVGTIISGMAMSSELMAMKAVEVNAERLIDLTEKSHLAMEKMRDIVWAIDSRKDKYGDLIVRMRSYSEKMFDDAGIEHKFIADGIEKNLFINPEKRQNVYLIFKEAVTNICKHSSANYVKISLNKIGNLIQLIIHDNGDDLTEQYESAGLGIQNMKMRAKQMGGNISFERSSGFVVCLEIYIT